MKKLIELIKKNPALKFYDAETQRTLLGKDITTNFFEKKDAKKLAFLYLDNSLNALEAFWHFFDSPHALVLLNPKLDRALKYSLEGNYAPTFIYDTTRDDITDYKPIDFINNQKFFETVKPAKNKIHRNLKILLTTSGTTGSPKLVRLSEKNIVSNALSIIQYLPIKSDDVTPLNLSVYYSYGLSILTTNAIAGGTIVCTNKDIMNKEFWTDFETLGYTTMAGVPYVYEMLYRIGFLKKEYPALRYMTQAGGKLSAKLVELFAAHLENQNKFFFVMYGQTEATARMSYLPPQYLKTKTGSIGIAIPGGKFSLASETNELIYVGANVFGGYVTSGEDLPYFEKINMLYTGDIATCDTDGFYYITGRMKRFIKIFGTRTSLDEVEALLKNEFIGKEFAVLGDNDENLWVCTLNTDLDGADIKQFLKNKIQIHPSVVKIITLKSFPLTPNGKTNYNFIKTHLQ